MSTNCTDCIKNKRTKPDGLCDDCRASCKSCIHVYDNASKNAKKPDKPLYYDGCGLGMIPPFPCGSIDLYKIGCYLHRNNLQNCPDCKTGRPQTALVRNFPGVFIGCDQKCGHAIVYGRDYREAVTLWNLLKGIRDGKDNRRND